MWGRGRHRSRRVRTAVGTGGRTGRSSRDAAGGGWRVAPAAMSGLMSTDTSVTRPTPPPPGQPARASSVSGRDSEPGQRRGTPVQGARVACTPCGRCSSGQPRVATWPRPGLSEVTILGLFSSSKMGQVPWPGAPTRELWGGGNPGLLTAGPAPGTWSVDTPESRRGPPGPPPGAPDPGPVQGDL